MPQRARCPASPSILLSGVCHHQSQDGSQPSLSAKSTTSGVRRRPKTSKARDAGKKQNHFRYMATPIKKPLSEGRYFFPAEAKGGREKMSPTSSQKRAVNGTLGRSLVGLRAAGVPVGQVLRLIRTRIRIRIRGLATPPHLQCRRLLLKKNQFGFLHHQTARNPQQSSPPYSSVLDSAE